VPTPIEVGGGATAKAFGAAGQTAKGAKQAATATGDTVKDGVRKVIERG
jgi:hypothetical protein